MATPLFAAYKLPRGRHGLPREHVAENQRWRLLGAAAELLAELGYRGLTTHKVAARAGVSSQTFYVHFGGLDDCLRAAFEVAVSVAGGSGRPFDSVELLMREPSLGCLFGLELRAAVPGIAAAFVVFARSSAPELRGRLILGAALTLISDASSSDEAAEFTAEVASLAARLSARPEPARRPPRRR